jgi:hypothetical protein
MTRTIWIAAFCLAVLGGLFATKVTASIPVAESTEPGSTVEEVFAQDTLTKGDKLSVNDVPHSTATIAVPTAEPVETRPVETKPVVASLVETKPVEITALETKAVEIKPATTVNRGAHRQTAVMLPRPRPKPRPAKSETSVKTATDAQPCHQPEGITGLIDAMNGVPRCNL